MITRIRWLVPFRLHVPKGLIAAFECEFEGHRVRVSPPYRTESGAESRLGDRFAPAATQSARDVLFDGVETVAARVFEFEFLACEPDRSENVTEPRVQVAFRLLNGLVDRLRGLAHAWMVGSIRDEDALWSVEYLSDSGTELAPIDGLVRFRGKAQIRLDPVVVMVPEIWNALQASVMRPTTAVEHLLLDAFGLLPQVGPAIVLAHTAIEVRLATALDSLAAANPNVVSGEVWKWINDERDNPKMLKKPSIREQLNGLFRCLTGRRLKDEGELWRDFERLNEARNKFAHLGRAQIRGEDVTSSEAGRLITRARQVVDWIETSLPEIERQARIELPPREIVVTGEARVPRNG